MQVATNQLICLLFWRTNQLICLLFFPANGNHGLDRWGMLVSQSHWQIVCRKIGHFAFRYVLIYLFFRENTWPHYQKMIYLFIFQSIRNSWNLTSEEMLIFQFFITPEKSIIPPENGSWKIWIPWTKISSPKWKLPWYVFFIKK